MTLSPRLVERRIPRLCLMSSSLLTNTTLVDSLSKVGGKAQPVPRNELNASFILLSYKAAFLRIQLVHPPICTVGKPATITPPCAVKSPCLAAGLLLMSTVVEPFTIVSGGPTHTSRSPTTAAGNPPIRTVGTPGPVTGPPTCGTGPVNIGQVCISVILAADGMILFD